MTIDEYLGQLRKLKRESDHAERRCKKLYDKLTSLHSASDFDGMPKGRTDYKSRQIALDDYADAAQRSSDAFHEYKAFSDELYSNICKCLYLDGLLLVTAYINNVVRGDDTLYGIGYILDTKDERVMISRLNEAKQHLRQVLINQGIELE